MASVSTLSVFFVLAALLIAVMGRKTRRNALPLPPGPRPLPLIGNILDLPSKEMRTAYSDMSAQYGDIMYLNVLGKPIIVLGSHKVAIDLLEKRSANYSDRPPSAMINIAGFEWSFAHFSYGQEWRRNRRAFHQHFNSNAVSQYAFLQMFEAHRLVNRLLEDPDNFGKHIRRFVGSSILRTTYGIEVDDNPVDYLGIAEEGMGVAAIALEPGKYLVELLPWIANLPAWFPGASVKRDGAVWRPKVRKMVSEPWDAVKEAMGQGLAPPSIARRMMERLGSGRSSADEEDVLKHVTAAAYAAGSDTTYSTMQTFFMAMVMHPEVQKKAQQELMSVIGPNRLPVEGDEPSLPYVQAVVRECLRWRAVVPLGLPHQSLEDDEYEGYFIPRGSLIITNIWASLHDPRLYANPETFDPQRFIKDEQIDPNVQDPVNIVFGYGRRVCAGQHFATTSLFIAIATVLHTLDISAAVGPDGKPCLPSGKMTHGFLSRPEPFLCKIQSRSPTAEALIRASCTELAREFRAQEDQ